MPHLSPMSWILTLLTLWFLLTMFSSLLWWTQTPSISLPYKPTPAQPNTWKWN